MTSRERIEAAFNHIAPDRTPVFEYVLLPPVAEELLGRRYADYADADGDWPLLAHELGWERAIRKYAADRVDLASLLGHDMMYVAPCPPANAFSLGEKPAAPSRAEEPSRDPVERMIQRNEQCERANPNPPDDVFLVYAYIKEELAGRGMDLPILAPAYAHGVWTDIDLMQTMLLEPGVARRHFALATIRAMKLIDRYIELDLDQVGIGGDFAGNRPIISPESYREFIVPEMRALSGRLREAGKRSVNASDGNLWEVIDDFLAGCGVDGYLEIDSNAGMELGKLKSLYGERFTFLGNMDCGTTLSFGAPGEIRRRTIRCLEDGTGNGGHIFCASNAITGSIPTGNYIAMIEAYRETFGLPKIHFPV